MIDPAARLAQISTEWEQNPGRAPGGSGSTGLLSNDAQGYTQMLEQQQEFMKLQDFLSGGEGSVNTRYGGELDPIRGGFDPATGRDNREAFGLPAGISGGALEGITAAINKKQRLDAAKKAAHSAGQYVPESI